MNNVTLAGLATSLVLLPTVAMAQAGPSSQASASAAARIVLPIAVGCGNMNFGLLAPLSNASATVVLPPQGDPLQDPQNVVVPGTRTNASPSQCTATGEQNLSYHVNLPAPITLSNGNGGTMPLGTFTISNELDNDPLNRLLDVPIGSLGSNAFGLGATLTVGAQQAPGVYTGSFTVTVQYN